MYEPTSILNVKIQINLIFQLKILCVPKICSTFAAEIERNNAQLKQLLQIVEENKEKLLKQWQVFKAGGTVKIIKINK